MKKLFLLIPALILSMMMNAKVIEIGSETSNIIHYTIAASTTNDGDVIVLTDEGPYVNSKANSDDYTKISKNVTIKAADGIHPVIKFEVPIQARDGKSGKFIGIKFDGSSLQYDHFIYFKDGNDNELEFEDCEFYNSAKYIVSIPSSTKAKSLVFKNCKLYDNTTNRGILNQGTIGHLGVYDCEFSGFVKDVIDGYSGASHVDSCIVKNSYFHNHSRSAIFFEASSVDGQQTCDKLVVKNSTFANINGTGDYHSVIDIRPYSAANAIKVEVDHCTFYNNTSINSDHANIRTANISDVTVSNCIFAHSEAYARRATYCTGGGNINNCLTYNYTADGTKGHAYGCTVNAASSVADPLFNDLANNKYTYAGDWTTMELSPARGAATDGTDLGDPRWYSDEILPDVDFASAYDLLGAKALLNGNIELNTSDHIAYFGSSTPGTATWKLHVTKACALSGVIDMETGNTSGCTLKLIAFDADGNKVDSLVAPYTDKDLDVTIPGCMYIPAEGNYTFKLYNGTGWSSSKVEKITLSYVGGTVQNMPGTTAINEAWYMGGTRADGKITFTSGHVSEGWAKWNVAFASAANYNVKLNVYSNNGKKFTVALQDANGNDVVTPLYLNGGAQHATDPVTLEMGAMSVPAGNYTLKVTNAEDWSDARIISVQFVRAGGGLINLPGDLSFDEVMLSERAWIDNDSLLFTARGDEGYNSSQWAKWNIHSENGGKYKFTLNAYNAKPATAQKYTLTVLAANDLDVIATIESAWNNENNEMTAELEAELEAGNYIFKVQNTVWGSNGRVMSIAATYEGGARMTLPTTLSADAALFSAKAYADGGEIYFSPDPTSQNVYGQWAKWNVNVPAAGNYLFTLAVTSTNSQTYKMTILDGETEVDSYEKHPSSGEQTIKHYFNLAAGNYAVKVENTYSWSNGHVVSLVVTQPSLLVLDEAAIDKSVIVANYRKDPQDIQITRSFVAGMYNTICLPFDVEEAELKAIFGNDVELLEMASATLDGDVLNLNFDAVTSIYRGTPYLIRISNAVVNPIFTGAVIKEENGQATSGDDVDFIGSFIKTTIDGDPNNLYLEANNTLNFSDNDVTMKGMRAYFHIKASYGGAVKRARIVVPNNMPTEIELVGSKNQTLKTIENGQVIIIRDGKKYNVMGIRL